MMSDHMRDSEVSSLFFFVFFFPSGARYALIGLKS